MTDRELEKALEIHRNSVYRLAVSYLKNAADSEDITQEAFIKLYMRRSPFEDDDLTRAWLLRVTANLCKNRLRSPWRKRRCDMPEEMPEAAGISPQERQELKSALESLSPENRAVIYLFYYEGLSAEMTGKALGLSVTAVTSRLQRSREAMKKFLSEDE